MYGAKGKFVGLVAGEDSGADPHITVDVNLKGVVFLLRAACRP